MEFIDNHDFARNIELGKYSQWAARIPSLPVQSLCWAIDAFVAALGDLSGKERAEESESLTGKLSIYPRAAMALQVLAEIRRTGKSDFSMPSGWDAEFSALRPAFVPECQQVLRQLEATAWAADLSERSLALLLWMVGEYAVRDGSKNASRQSASSVGETGSARDRAEKALALISMIYHGHPISIADLNRAHGTATDRIPDLFS